MPKMRDYRVGDAIIEAEEVSVKQKCQKCGKPLPYYSGLDFALCRRRLHTCECGAVYKTKFIKPNDGKIWEMMESHTKQ